jgi:hypothetical protein
MGELIDFAPRRALCSLSQSIRFRSVVEFFLMTKTTGSRRFSSGIPTPVAIFLSKSRRTLVNVFGRRDESKRPTPMMLSASGLFSRSRVLSNPMKPESIRR